MAITMTTTTLVTIATVTTPLCHSVADTIIIMVVVDTVMPWDWCVSTLLKVHMLHVSAVLIMFIIVQLLIKSVLMVMYGWLMAEGKRTGGG